MGEVRGSGPRAENRKPGACVRPVLDAGVAGPRQQIAKAVHGVLVRVFRVDALAAAEAPLRARPADTDVAQRLQVHLNARAGLVLVGHVARSEDRRGGKECVRTCRSRWWTFS